MSLGRRCHRLLAVSASFAFSVTLLVGCGDDSNDAESQPPNSQSSTPEPTVPSSTLSPSTPESTALVTPEEQAAADAEVVVRDYLSFVDRVIADRSVDLGRLDSFLQNPELAEQRDYFDRFRDQGFYSDGGSTTFEWIRATKVRLDAKTREAAVTLRTCRNVDDLDVRFENGDEVDTLSPSLGIYQVFNYDYPNATGWKIAIESSPGKRCQP